MLSLRRRSINFPIGKNYHFELSMFHQWREYKGEINLITLTTDLHFNKNRDHNPRFDLYLEIFNYVIVDLSLYNIHHAKKSKNYDKIH